MLYRMSYRSVVFTIRFVTKLHSKAHWMASGKSDLVRFYPMRTWHFLWLKRQLSGPRKTEAITKNSIPRRIKGKLCHFLSLPRLFASLLFLLSEIVNWVNSLPLDFIILKDVWITLMKGNMTRITCAPLHFICWRIRLIYLHWPRYSRIDKRWIQDIKSTFCLAGKQQDCHANVACTLYSTSILLT